MKHFTNLNDPEIIELLENGAIGVIRTDTLYGVVANATNQVVVDRVYGVKGRDDTKSPIVLIADPTQLFDEPSHAEQSLLDEVWPGKVSVIMSSKAAPSWITRGNASVAYRLPADETLRGLLRQTGPLIAPSANPQGQPPAMTIDEAIGYFGDEIDFYVNGGHVTDDSPSQLLRLDEYGTVERLR